jgi:hypothetical protein
MGVPSSLTSLPMTSQKLAMQVYQSADKELGNMISSRKKHLTKTKKRSQPNQMASS